MIPLSGKSIKENSESSESSSIQSQELSFNQGPCTQVPKIQRKINPKKLTKCKTLGEKFEQDQKSFHNTFSQDMSDV